MQKAALTQIQAGGSGPPTFRFSREREEEVKFVVWSQYNKEQKKAKKKSENNYKIWTAKTTKTSSTEKKSKVPSLNNDNTLTDIKGS